MSFTNGYDGYDRFIIIIIRVMLNAVNIPNHTFSEAGLRCRIYIITLCVIVAVAVILLYMYLWLLRLFRFYF